MVAKTLEVTPQAARRIVLELGLREMTGRGRFRAWGKTAKAQRLIQSEIDYLSYMRNTFMHGSDIVLNPPMFLTTFQMVTTIIRELFAPLPRA
jgi:hypothetical protein